MSAAAGRADAARLPIGGPLGPRSRDLVHCALRHDPLLVARKGVRGLKEGRIRRPRDVGVG